MQPIILLIALVLLAGCATPKPTEIQGFHGEKDHHIAVYFERDNDGTIDYKPDAWLWLAEDGTVRWSYAE